MVSKRLPAGQSSLRLRAAATDFTLFQNVQTSSGIHLASYSTDAGSKVAGAYSEPSFPSTARLIMTGAIPLPLPIGIHGV